MIQKSNTSGGAAVAGGLNFQAAISAIAYIHALRGAPVQWLDGLTVGAPVSISSETGGPGDDLSLKLTDGSLVEVQVKKGLNATNAFWSAVDSLSEGIDSGRCNYGILIVCPASSNTIRSGFAKAIRRIGEKRFDHPSNQQVKFTKHLQKQGYDPTKICERMRIKTVSALSDHDDAIAAALAELGHVCANTPQIKSAWIALYEKAMRTIELKGRQTSSSLISVLQSFNIAIKSDDNDTPAAVNQALLEWIDRTTEEFTALGIDRSLSTDTAWLQLNASVGNDAIEHNSSIEDALHAYHALSEKSVKDDRNRIDAKTIGTFRKLCVVFGGPGCGKSLLMKVLAREFGKDSIISLQVRLPDLANRLKVTGCTVEEGLLSLGLAGSGVSSEQFGAVGFLELVYLCDGLDECGDYQPIIASGLKNISLSSASCRIIVTTRPIGYDTSELRRWRHYEIMPLNPDDVADQLETLCRCALGTVSDSEDNLSDDIANYVNASEARKFISTSPLLLVFAAALFLKWKTLGESRLDLYVRIFKLIDIVPVPRKSNSSFMSKAIRDSVLNHLGWLICTSPLLTAEQIEKRCAETIGRDFNEPYMKSLSLAQNSITYWEEVGLIERLHHSGQDLMTFIHKTCGEFAAARHLETLGDTEARQLMEKELDNPEWAEILDFATQTSMAEMIASVIIERAEIIEPSSQLIDRAFHVLTRPEIHLCPSKTASFLKKMFSLAQDGDRQKAYKIGACLVNNDMSQVSEVAAEAEHLLTAEAEWSRLIGWSVLTCHFPDRLDRSQLEEAVLHYAALNNDDNLFILQKESLFSKRLDREVFELFLINALEHLLKKNQTSEYQDKLLSSVGNLGALQSFGSLKQIKSLLRRIGREDAISMFKAMQGLPRISEILGNINMSQFRTDYRMLFGNVVASAFIVEPAPAPPRTGMKHLGAFFQLAQIDNVPVDDVNVWAGEGELLYVHELLRIATFIFELPLDRLAAEAQSFYNAIKAQMDDERLVGIFEMIPSVDAAEIDWERAKWIDFDNTILEELVHHPSLWLKFLAAFVLDSRLSETERFEACKRMLETGRSQTLRIAASMAADLPDRKGQELILAKLSKPLTSSAYYLFDQLAEDEFPVECPHTEVLMKGLISSSTKVAKSAAKWCSASANESSAWLLPLLQQAFEYWIENEQPYPKNGGVVPDSPREALYCAMRAINKFTFNDLVELSKDSRNDVSRLAMGDLVSIVTESDNYRSQLVDEICAKSFPPARCTKLFDFNIPYSQDNLTKLCALLKDVDPAYRRVAIQILLHPRMDQMEGQGLATQMKDDNDGYVRDAAYRCLDSFGPDGMN